MQRRRRGRKKNSEMEEWRDNPLILPPQKTFLSIFPIREDGKSCARSQKRRRKRKVGGTPTNEEGEDLLSKFSLGPHCPWKGGSTSTPGFSLLLFPNISPFSQPEFYPSAPRFRIGFFNAYILFMHVGLALSIPDRFLVFVSHPEICS